MASHPDLAQFLRQDGLHGELITLREISAGDWKFLYDYWRYDSFYRYRAVPIPTPEYVRECVDQYIIDGAASPRLNYWLIATQLRKPIQCVGIVSLRITEGDGSYAEIGYSIHHTMRGRGYATAAARDIIEFGNKELNIRIFRAKTAEGNIGSRRVLVKLGFTLVGNIENPKPIRGQYVPGLIYELQLK